MKSQITQKERFRVCLHESAHVVLWLKRTSSLLRPMVKAVVYENGNGQAHSTGSLSDFSYAIIRAAGAHAERLSKTYPTPKRQSAQPTEKQISSEKRIAPAIGKIIKQSFSSDIYKLKIDSQVVAEFCITLYPDKPKEWVRRHRRINAIARHETWLYREEIVNIAKKLYQDSVYYAPAEKDPHVQT